MRSLSGSTALLGCLILAACGGSGPDLRVVNDASVAFSENGEVLSLGGTDLVVSLPLDPEYDRGTFVGAKQFGEDFRTGQILAVSETDDSFAALLIDRPEDGAITSQQFIGRTTEFESLPTGSATLTGTYVGTFNEVDPTHYTYASGDVTLDVNFDKQTI